VPERSRGRQTGAAPVALRVALLVTLVPLLAAACGDDAGGDAATQTATVAETVGETTTDAGTTTAATTTAPSPPTAPPGPMVRFRGSGDRTLPAVAVGRGGATLRWQNADEVFSLFYQGGMVIDSVERGGETFIPAGRYAFAVVASGGWTIELQNARRAG
jgi:hypothetical protein